MNEAITRDILRKVRQIEIRTNRIVADSLAGHYHSVFKGRGMDFDEVREYVPGDEVRTIDWNVTARAGRPFIKKFAEERELTLLLLVDVSASGHFGSGMQKQTQQCRRRSFACVLALPATRSTNDKVGLVLFTDQIELYIPPKKGRRHVLRVVREILFFRPVHRGTDIVQALEFSNRMSGRRSVVFLISDFQSAGIGIEARSPLRRAFSQAARRHDLVAVNIRDPREQSLPDVGVAVLQDAETGEVMEVDTASRRTRELFAGLAQKSRDTLLRMLNAEAIDSLMLSTDQPYLGALISFFRRREARHS